MHARPDDLFLGLDLGTTHTKALVVASDGAPLARGSAPVTLSTTSDGGAEQDAGQIWNAACEAIRQATSGLDPRSVRAVGVSSQGGALQLLDADEEPLGPVVSWLDTRGTPFDRRLDEELGESYLAAHVGRRTSTTALGQLLRIRQQSPERFKAAAGIGFVGDMIVRRLCGRRAHDPTSLSIATLLNPRLGQADPELLERLGIARKRLPELIPASLPAGGLTSAAAAQTGLGEGIPVSGAVHDQYAASLGAGAVEVGDVLVGTGTAWVLLAISDRLAPPVTPRAFVCPHPVGGRFGQMLSMRGVGAAIDWALQTLGAEARQTDALDELLAATAPGAEDLRFQPSPAREGSASPPGGTFEGRTPAHGPGHLLRAVVEGLACELARHVDGLVDAGTAVRRLVLTGPAAAGAAVAQILANTTGRPVACVDERSTSALGAAAIAQALASGEAPLGAIAGRFGSRRRTIEPDADGPRYRQLLGRWLAGGVQYNR